MNLGQRAPDVPIPPRPPGAAHYDFVANEWVMANAQPQIVTWMRLNPWALPVLAGVGLIMFLAFMRRGR